MSIGHKLGCFRDTGLELSGRQRPPGPRDLGCRMNTRGGTSTSLSPAPPSTFLGGSETPEDRTVGLKYLGPRRHPHSPLHCGSALTLPHLPRNILSASLPLALRSCLRGAVRSGACPGVVRRRTAVHGDMGLSDRGCGAVIARGRLADADTHRASCE